MMSEKVVSLRRPCTGTRESAHRDPTDERVEVPAVDTQPHHIRENEDDVIPASLSHSDRRRERTRLGDLGRYRGDEAADEMTQVHPCTLPFETPSR